MIWRSKTMEHQSGIVAQLITILLEIDQTISKIYEIEDQKYDIIKNMDIDQLMILNQEESLLVYQIDQLEQKRFAIVEKLATILGFDAHLPISQMALHFQADDREKILVLSINIKNICSRLDVVTERNDYILNSHSEIISQILTLSQGVSVDQYNQKGIISEMKQQRLHMLDQII